MATLVAMGTIQVSCVKPEDEVTPQPKDNIVTLTTTVGFEEVSGTKALTPEGVKTFAEGDQIAVIYKNTSDETVKAVSAPLPSGTYGNTASFTFR